MNNNILAYIENFSKNYDKRYNKLIEQINKKEISKKLKNYLFYTPNLRGKLLRSLFAYRSCEIFNISEKIRENISVVIELFQSFTLIHDDLPSLDNDDFRRGKPTLHKVLNEADAILIGDALSILTFYLFSEIKEDNLDNKFINGLLKFINEFSNFAVFSLIDGQIMDIESTKIKNSKEDILKIYEKKTASFFGLALSSGAIIIQDEKAKEELYSCGNFFGMAFQLADDIEDYISEKEKKINSFSVLYGLEETKKLLKQYKEPATQIIEKYDDKILYKIFLSYFTKWAKKFAIEL